MADQVVIGLEKVQAEDVGLGIEQGEINVVEGDQALEAAASALETARGFSQSTCSPAFSPASTAAASSPS